MKKIISILLAVMLVVSVACVSVGAYNSDGDYSKMTSGSEYNPEDSYTVDENTPYSEEAISTCTGSLADTQKVYFQAPDPEKDNWANKYNTFAGPDDSEPYMHVCIYWWTGNAIKWPSGGNVKWCGYQAHLIDKENRIYMAYVPTNTTLVTWNNGVNGGMDESAEIFTYAHQIFDTSVQGCAPGDEDSLPEGTPHEDDNDGCISIVDFNNSNINPLTGFPQYGSNWFIYYGQGCYGSYLETSASFHGRTGSCINPEHHHADPGDANNDKSIDMLDVLCIQRYLAELPQPLGGVIDTDAADVDSDEFVSIIDATRIQRYLAHICNLNGSKPYTG